MRKSRDKCSLLTIYTGKNHLITRTTMTQKINANSFYDLAPTDTQCIKINCP